MTESDPLSDVFTLFAAPIAGAVRSIEQFRRGVDEFLRGVENFNTTMENLNVTTQRINRLLEDVEQPLRDVLPQVSRTVRMADEMFQVVSGPAIAAAPGLKRLADTLSTPAFEQLPNQLSLFSEMLGDVSRRMGPLAQLAESAGGLFGLRFPGFGGGTGRHDTGPGAGDGDLDPAPPPRPVKRTASRATPSEPEPAPAPGRAARTTPRAGTKKAAAKQRAAKQPKRAAGS